MKRTIGAAIGAVIFVLFMSFIATRLTPQFPASAPTPVEVFATNP